MNKEVIISVRNLFLSYGDNLILDNISLDFYAGDRVAIIGRNGSGKTSFIESILGLNKTSTSTRIYINDSYKNFI